jgi:hypothetical protein
MPSLHATWGLLLIFAVINDYKKRVQRWTLVESGFLIFGILTILGALIHGEHYLLDVVVAIPLAAGLYSLMYNKTNSAIPGLVLTAFSGLTSALTVLDAGGVVDMGGGRNLGPSDIRLVDAKQRLLFRAHDAALVRHPGS